MSIYEVHLGSWRRKAGEGNRWLTYRETAEELIPYVKDMGFNFIEFLPLSEHPFDGSWGYQVTGYYAATSRYGLPEDLMFLVDRCHAEGIGVILDWVPAHFPRDSYALEYFDGTHLYEHEDPRQGVQKDWDTLIFNYGRTEVKNFLIANALFWFDKYHVDGLRMDAVASMLYLDYSRKEGEWIPNRYGGRENLEAIDFIKSLNAKAYQQFPGIVTIAEESTAWPGVTLPVHLGGLGFMFKWNMGWMHDMLSFISKDPIHRRFHMNMLTFALLYAFHENFILPLSHDEVVHGKASLLSKMPGDEWRKFANLRLLLGYMYAEPGKKMLFMGAEFGQWWEWDHDHSIQWHLLQYAPHQGLQQYVKDLNRIYRSEPAMYELDYHSDGF
jgi:1,4-alpha-glucan branching enzyme